LTCSLSVLYNYFNNPTELFSNLYLAKFLDTSAKPFFPCTQQCQWNVAHVVLYSYVLLLIGNYNKNYNIDVMLLLVDVYWIIIFLCKF